MKHLKSYPKPDGLHTVTLVAHEVTCMGTSENPDFYRVTIEYVPDSKIVCTKALKQWFTAQRDQVYSAERLAVVIRDVIQLSVTPRYIAVTTEQAPRGGIAIEACSRTGPL